MNQDQLMFFLKRQIDELERIAREMQANWEAHMVLKRKEWASNHRRLKDGKVKSTN